MRIKWIYSIYDNHDHDIQSLSSIFQLCAGLVTLLWNLLYMMSNLIISSTKKGWISYKRNESELWIVLLLRSYKLQTYSTASSTINYIVFTTICMNLHTFVEDLNSITCLHTAFPNLTFKACIFSLLSVRSSCPSNKNALKTNEAISVSSSGLDIVEIQFQCKFC